MPGRLLREGILDSEAVNSLSLGAEVFYRRLMSAVDDFGRFDARPAVLRSRLYPLRLDTVTDKEVAAWTRECERAGLLTRYTAEGKPYLLFHRLGSPRAKASKYPAPPPEAEATAPAPPAQSEGEGECTQSHADARTCAQTPADAPYSGSGSGTSAGSSTGASKSGRAAEPRPHPADVPAPLDTPEFRSAWADWLADRRERKRKPYTERGVAGLLAELAKHGPAAAVAAIRESIRNGYQGLFPEKHTRAPPGKGRGYPTRTDEILHEIDV